jgi:hypothetical protein
MGATVATPPWSGLGRWCDERPSTTTWAVRAILTAMGHRRPRSLLLGAVVLAAVLGSTSASASQPVAHAVVHGAVDAEGAPTVAPDGWRVAHPAPGRYVVRVRADRASLDVRLWDEVADVTVLPLGRGATEVRFARAGRPVDTAFGFVAIRER